MLSEDKMARRIVTGTLDPIILLALGTRPMSGFEVVGFIMDEFNILYSPGTIYFRLNHLEKLGYVKYKEVKYRLDRRIYSLTNKGMERVGKLLDEWMQIHQRFLALYHRVKR